MNGYLNSPFHKFMGAVMAVLVIIAVIMWLVEKFIK